ncbi:MAG: HDIG domain-containing protein [Paludibacteraceae bacterium]|nr:HDIG domain-containing protein [Paludibacteraceae bacterium]
MKRYLKIIPFVVFAGIVFYLFPHYENNFSYSFEVGKPWNYERLTAPSDFPIYKTQDQLNKEQQELLADFAPCYVFCDTITSPLVLSYEDREALIEQKYRFISVLEDQVARRYPIRQVFTPKTAFECYGVTMSPNIVLDSVKTAQLKESILSVISPTQGVVQEGEKIIDTGELVTEHNYLILISLRKVYEQSNRSHQQKIFGTIGTVLLLCFVIAVFAAFFFFFSSRGKETWSAVIFFCFLPLLLVASTFLLMGRFVNTPLYIIPFAWVPLVVRSFFDARMALVTHLVTILICALAVPFPLEFLFVQTLVGAVTIVSMQDMSKRTQVVQTVGWIVLTYVVAYTAFCLISPTNVASIDWHTYIYIVLNGILVICGSYGLILASEHIFGFISATTLIELTNVNSTLLQDFAQKAPGSFQHSLQVGNLASEAAKKIGANALLVRTGALYHDIGKMLHPEYFIENQTGGVNPLIDLDAREAARIVLQHVEDGVKLGQKAHLPAIIIQFIRSHHGTSLTRFFYNTYVNSHPGAVVDDSLFRYAGPKPSTKEGAILMMADAIEARSRSLSSYTEESIWNMIVDMTDQQIKDKQFTDTPLSFKDLEDIRLVFKERLISIYHHRIKYPTLNL